MITASLDALARNLSSAKISRINHLPYSVSGMCLSKSYLRQHLDLRRSISIRLLRYSFRKAKGKWQPYVAQPNDREVSIR